MAHPPCVMVVFGASGDLTRRKLMPALYNLHCDGLLHDHFAIVGFARRQKTDEQFRSEMREAVGQKSRHPASEEDWEKFASRLHYVTGRYDDPESFRTLGKVLMRVSSKCGTGPYLSYLALPPDVIKDVLAQMKDSPLAPEHAGENGSRIMIEKPFGRDLASAEELNRLISEIFDESHIYRIDHYIAKDTVRNLLVFRFTNAIFEPLWNHEHVDNIQITAAENIGVEGRGSYYEQTGIVRDMIQNHVLQVLALTVMEPPLAGDAESVRDKKVEVFKSLAPIAKDDFVFGQYDGYREESNVEADSCTPTFAALRISINNWRWKGVPFYVRSGKHLAKKVTEVVVEFKNAPICVLDNEEACRRVNPNILTIRIQPDEGMRLRFCVKVPGREDEIDTANLDFRYSDFGKQFADAYEQVLLDCMHGKPALFWRSDGVEAAWQAVDHLLTAQEDCASVCSYKPGSWGPEEANKLIQKDGRSWLESY